MAGPDNRPIIVKKVKKVAGGHHGGAWKVAYADFVTAMMAFFLMLWLLNVTTDEQKAGIANYFSPSAASKATSGSGGVLGGQTIMAPGSLATGGAPAIVMAISPPGEPGEPKPPQDSGDEASGENASGAFTSAVATPAPGDVNALSDSLLAQEMAKREEKRFEEAMAELKQSIQSIPELAELSRQIVVDVTPEGMRIQLVDEERKPMFTSGSATLPTQTRQLLAQVARIVNAMPNRVIIAGHTDAQAFRTGTGYSNWELSADRANAARRALLSAGVPQKRIYQVAGKADSEPLLPDAPFDATNRRISIVLLREAPVVPARL